MWRPTIAHTPTHREAPLSPLFVFSGRLDDQQCCWPYDRGSVECPRCPVGIWDSLPVISLHERLRWVGLVLHHTHTHTLTHTPIHNKRAALFILLICHKAIACTCTQIHTHNTDSVQMLFLAQRQPRAPLSRPFVLWSCWWRRACWRCLPEKLTDNSQTPPSSLCVYAWSFTDRLREHVCALIILIHWLWLIVCVLTRIHELYVNSMTWWQVGVDCSVLTLSTVP